MSPAMPIAWGDSRAMKCWSRLSVEMLGHRGFYMEHGIDLYAEAVRFRDETLGRKAA
jgi:hypothetical protein